jgi:hypothetical protein
MTKVAGVELPALLQLIQEANSKCCQANQKVQFVVHLPPAFPKTAPKPRRATGQNDYSILVILKT